MSLISCPACGNEVSSEASACPKCGHPIAAPAQRKPFPVKAVVITLAVLAVIAAIIFVTMLPKMQLKADLTSGSWSHFDDDLNQYVLTFKDDLIQYDIETILLGTSNISSYRYEILSGNEISIKGSKYNVKFNDGKSMMILDPAFLDETYWHLH